MDASKRETVRQTADDFEWLESHCRTRSDLARYSGELRLAAALLRSVIGPAVDGVSPPPLFLSVVGGAGSGKSTTVNFLVGSAVAEANPQAGYTRHPTAFVEAGTTWPSHLGFIGPLRRLDTHAPSNLDEDVYQVRKLPAHSLSDFVVWDCPDMTTWASVGYVSRLLEVAALSDVIVYVASDERYNDEVPSQFLQMLIRSGKAVVVVLTKMKEENLTDFIDHFRREVLLRVASPEVGARIPIVAIPQLTLKEKNDPGGAGAKWRVPLVNQLLVLCPTLQLARDRTVTNAIRFLESASGNLVEVARTDLAELDSWRSAVITSKAAFEARYRNEYLSGEPFQLFERSRREVLTLLDLPGRGQIVSGILAKIRWPFEFVAQHVSKLASRPSPPVQPEQTVLMAALTGWLDSLQAEALRRTATHSIWKTLAAAFDSGLKADTMRKFEEAASSFERQEVGELESAAKSLGDDLVGAPSRLTAIRGGVIALEVTAIMASIWWTFHSGLSFWNLLWIVPLAGFLAHGIAELGVHFAVERTRRSAKSKREALLAGMISQPLAEWLITRPISGGSPVERLQAILQRVPRAIDSLTTTAKSA